MKEQDRENNFENQLRQKAAGFRMKPSDDVWANVKISLQQDRRKRRFIWLWTAAAGILLGIGITSLYFINQMNSERSSSITNATSETAPEENQPSTAELSPEREIVVSKDNDGIETSINSKANTTAGHSAIAIEQEHKNEINKRNDASDPLQTPITEETITSTNPSTVASNTSDITNASLSENKNLSGEQVGALTTLNVPSTLLLNADENNVIAYQPDIHTGQPGMNFNTSRFSISGEIIPLVSRINYKSLNTGSAFSTTTDVAFADSISKLSQSSGEPLMGFSCGISGQYKLSKKIALGAGIHFTSTGEKNAFLKANNPTYLEDSASIAGNGGINFIPGKISTTGNIASVTRYTWLDFSLNGEWYFFQKQKNELSLFAGVGLSKFIKYNYSADGYATSEIQNNSFFNNSQNPPVFHVYNVTSSAGINYHRMISDHFSLVAGMQFHYYLTNIALSDIPLAAHPYWFGINTGVSYRF
ncbi:MAG: hypothetical protein ABI729_04680 [Chitinophagales bacterium]